MSKGYIYSTQIPMFGHKEILGYGSDNFYVKEIDRAIANEVIKKNHYSKKYFNNSYIHLGVFINSEFLGVLQYGHLLNNNSVSSIVEGTKNGEACELNRMWLDDRAKRNSESKSISYSFKYLKRKYPNIKWVQSFADERCGGFGIVYQACSFNYFGEHTSTFWELDGIVYHNSMMTSKKAGGKKYDLLQANKERCTSHTLRQFRYIKFINQKWKKKCLLTEMPYPKHYY